MTPQSPNIIVQLLGRLLRPVIREAMRLTPEDRALLDQLKHNQELAFGLTPLHEASLPQQRHEIRVGVRHPANLTSNELLMYIEETGGRAAFAERIGISPGLISHFIHGRRKPGPKLAKRIEELTGGRVTKQQLRPDIFA